MFALLRPPSEGTPSQLSVSPPLPNRNLGERDKLPHRGPGRSSGRKRVLVHLELERTHLMDRDKFRIFLTNIYPYFYDWKPMRRWMRWTFDILHKNFQECQLISRRFPGFPGVVDTLKQQIQTPAKEYRPTTGKTYTAQNHNIWKKNFCLSNPLTTVIA